MSPFDTALAFTLQWEGGLVDHPNDPGGLTNFGISQRAYPALDIRNLTREQAADIYLRDYWQKGHCDRLSALIAIAHFDAAVNCGHVQAAKLLQRAIDVDDDGAIGPRTLAAARIADPLKAALGAIKQRDRYYTRLVEAKPKYGTFLKGWLRRTAALRELIGGQA